MYGYVLSTLVSVPRGRNAAVKSPFINLSTLAYLSHVTIIISLYCKTTFSISEPYD